MDWLYTLTRSALFTLDAETAHALTIRSLACMGPMAGAMMGVKASAPVEVMGLRFPNPVGVAAGLDKNGECIAALHSLGFGFVEVGTVTPRPQPGNPKPRMFRLPEQGAVINRLGFNNEGVEALCRRVERLARRPVLGINIGKNATTPLEQALEDYRFCLERVYPLADYVTVNISSPNTKGLRDLQAADPLRQLLDGLMETREGLAGVHGRKVPLALKLAPDLDAEQIEATATAINAAGIDAVIATNTTITRPGLETLAIARETGGLSGAPLTELAQATFRALREHIDGSIPMIGAGGICSGEDAGDRFAAGAALIQLYTGFVYAGPRLIADAVDAYLQLQQSPAR